MARSMQESAVEQTTVTSHVKDLPPSKGFKIIIVIFLTLGIKDPEGLGKKLEENVSE